MEFSKNPEMRLGVELELQMIDPVTMNLKPTAAQILQDIETTNPNPHIKSELFRSMLEIDTPIVTSAHEAGISLRQSLQQVIDVARKNDSHVVMSGTHPFAHYSERQVSDNGRYYKLLDRNQWIARRLQIFGLHVHLGMRDGEHAMAMNNAFCHYLPVILAISANSPYWESDDTGLASSRITLFEAMPTGGHPYTLGSWKEFEMLVDRLIFSKSITSLKDLWWDLRPNPSYGTLEVRIADCPTTIRETESLVALIHALAKFIDKELIKGKKFASPPEWILRENKWRASRYGVCGELIIDSIGTSVPFHEFWRHLKEMLAPTIQEMGYQYFFSYLDRMVEDGPGYMRQRQAFQNGGFEGIVKNLIHETLHDAPTWVSRQS